jgi:hypothetical protein
MTDFDQHTVPDGDELLIIALAEGRTVRDAAAAAGVSEKTAHRRLIDAAFRARVAQARGELFGQALGRLADSATEAVGTLRGLLTAAAPTVQLGAARAILEHAAKFREHVELESRMRAIEERIGFGAASRNGHAEQSWH